MKSILTGTAVMLALTAPATAQDTICGGISLVGEWVGGDPAGADVTTAPSAFDSVSQTCTEIPGRLHDIGVERHQLDAFGAVLERDVIHGGRV